MQTRQSGVVLGRIRTLFNEGRIGTMTDEQLLGRFASRRADAAEAVEAAEVAFEVLVLRHGPMVLGVCRRVLRDPHEVEDAFQATFLILARRAGSIRKREVLGGWLRKVAHRVAARARALSVRRGAFEPIRPGSAAEDPGTIVEREDLFTAVLDEVQLLPEKYRLPVQLCYLEGQTHDEAARRLAWPVGTVRTRLAWARDRLRSRLTRRGLVVPAGFIGTSLVSLTASAEVPASLVRATVDAATGLAGGAAATSLATNVLRAMLFSQIRLAVVCVLVAGSVAGVALPLSRTQLGKAGPVVAERGTSIGGVVRDEDGRPIGGVTVALHDKAPDDRAREAPDDSVTVFASAPGFPRAELSREPSETESVSTLRNFLRIRGTVTDAETGRAIETFSVVPGIQIGDPFPVWMFGLAKTHHGGHYEFLFDTPAPGIPLDSVRIEAKGYLPAVSPAHAYDAGEQVFDARLKKGEWIEGVVRGPDGAPLTGAEVILVTGRVFGGIVMGGEIRITGGKAVHREYHPHLLTGADGRFSFPAPEGPYGLVALHDQGYAEATGQQLAEMRGVRYVYGLKPNPDTEATGQQLAELRGLTTQPWGRIEGALRVGGKPLAREIIVASVDQARIDPNWLSVQNESHAQTDEHGRFVIERIAPGAASVYWRPAKWDARTTGLRYYQPAFLDVVPGQTIRVDLTQEGGRPLVGRVVVPDAAGHRLELAGSSANLLVKLPEVPYPPGLAQEDRQQWLSRWRVSQAAREYRYRQSRRVAHALTFQPDGSFRIDEVQPGTYELQIVLPWFELIRDVTIPKPAVGQGGAPVDLGTFALKRSATADPGR